MYSSFNPYHSLLPWLIIFLFLDILLCSAWPTGRGHQRAQAGAGEEGGVSAAEPGSQRERAEGRTEGAHWQKHEGQSSEQVCHWVCLEGYFSVGPALEEWENRMNELTMFCVLLLTKKTKNRTMFTSLFASFSLFVLHISSTCLQLD